MKKIVLFSFTAVLFLATASAFAQAPRNIHPDREYSVRDFSSLGSFSEIEAVGNISFEYAQTGGSHSISVEAPQNLFEYIEVKISRGKLSVKLDNDIRIRGRYSIKVKASSPSLGEISIAGSSSVTVYGQLIQDNDLNMSIAGSGRINIPAGIEARNIKADVAGSGSIYSADVTCRNLSSSASGSSRIRLDNIEASSANISIAGSGDVQVSGIMGSADFNLAGSGSISADNIEAARMAVTVAGSGDITITGFTGTVAFNAMGSGDIRAGGLVAESASVTIAGSADVEYNASGQTSVNVMGSGRARNVASPM